MTTNKSQNQAEKAQFIKSALPVGTILRSPICNYRILEVLGAGGFGITYKVIAKVSVGNVEVEMPFVVKEYFPKGCFRASDGCTVAYAPNIKDDFLEGRKDFNTEADRLNKFGQLSPNIVKVNEHFAANNTVYYAMEYLDGGNLHQFVKKNGPLNEAQALQIICTIARAVGLLHREGLLHLDIKPENIVLKKDGNTGISTPVLIDFGLARRFDKKGNPVSRLTQSGVAPGYAPIEQYDEISKFAPEIDIYALGATLCFLLTGKDPSVAFNVNLDELVRSLPTKVSQRTRIAITRAMQKDARERTKDIPSFLASLEESVSLPAGTILRNGLKSYLIIKLIDQQDYYIHYQAIPETNQRNISGETPVLKKFDVYESFARNRDRRGSDGIRVCSANDDLASNLNGAKAKAWLELKDSLSKANAPATFHTNNTDYIIAEQSPNPPTPKMISIIFLVAVVIILCVVVAKCMSSTKPNPTKEEQLKEAIENEDTTKMLSLLGDNYEDAAGPLAQLFNKFGNEARALEIAKEYPNNSVCKDIIRKDSIRKAKEAELHSDELPNQQSNQIQQQEKQNIQQSTNSTNSTTQNSGKTNSTSIDRPSVSFSVPTPTQVSNNISLLGETLRKLHGTNNNKMVNHVSGLFASGAKIEIMSGSTRVDEIAAKKFLNQVAAGEHRGMSVGGADFNSSNQITTLIINE